MCVKFKQSFQKTEQQALLVHTYQVIITIVKLLFKIYYFLVDITRKKGQHLVQYTNKAVNENWKSQRLA